MSVVGDGESLRPVQRIRLRVDEREKAAFVVEHLDPRVAPIGDDDDVGFGVDGHARRSVELPVAFAAGSEGEEESAVGRVEHFDAVIVIIRDQHLV